MRETRGGYLLSRAKQVGGRIFDRMLVESGIDAFNGAQGRILYVLWNQDGLPISRLSALTGLAKTTLTSMLDRMEASDLIRREPVPEDRRQIRIALTEKARALRSEYARISGAMNDLYYKGFADHEVQAFEQYLLRILDNLEGGASHVQGIDPSDQ